MIKPESSGFYRAVAMPFSSVLSGCAYASLA